MKKLLVLLTLSSTMAFAHPHYEGYLISKIDSNKKILIKTQNDWLDGYNFVVDGSSNFITSFNPNIPNCLSQSQLLHGTNDGGEVVGSFDGASNCSINDDSIIAEVSFSAIFHFIAGPISGSGYIPNSGYGYIPGSDGAPISGVVYTGVTPVYNNQFATGSLAGEYTLKLLKVE